MSETIQPLTGEERRDRIKDIRERKGHLLGRGIIVSGNNPGFVPAMPLEDPLKYSVLVRGTGEYQYPYSEHFGPEFGYVYKGAPDGAIRQAESSQSEYAELRRPLAQLAINFEQYEGDKS